MKVKDLIKELQKIPENDDIFIMHTDEIMGYYNYDDPILEETEAYRYLSKRGFVCHSSPGSNYTPNEYEEVKIWRLT